MRRQGRGPKTTTFPNSKDHVTNWFVGKKIMIDFGQDFKEMEDDAFDKVVEMAMRGHVGVTTDLHFVDHQVPIDSSSYSCPNSFLWFDEMNSAVDHDLFKTCCARILERFERDYALELGDLSDLSPFLTRQEILSVLEFLVTIGRLGKEDTIYYYCTASFG